MKKSLLHFCLILFYFLTCFTFVSAQQDAGQPGEFLRYGVNARALGMGRAFTAVTDNANAIYWNPGGLYNIVRDGLSLTLMYSKLYQSTTYNFAAFAIPLELLISADKNSGIAGELKKWNLGFGYLGLSSDDFEVRNSFNQPTGEMFSDAQTAIYFSIARAFAIKSNRFGLGLNYKLLNHKIFDQKANTIALDFGVKYQPSLSWLEIGANFQNINSPDFKFAQGGSDKIPFSARLGVAVAPKTWKKMIDAYCFSFDFVAIPPGERDIDWFAGMEYDLMSTVYNLPVKLRFGVNSRENFTFGINLDLPNNIFYTQANQLLPTLDWAYLPGQQNSMGGISERFSLDFSYTQFTSKRWYKRGLEKFKDEQFSLAKDDLTRAILAKNPQKLGFPIAASLRLGDLEVYSANDKFVGLKSALSQYRQVSLLERSIEEIDPELNHISYLNFLQGLFIEKQFNEIIRYTTMDSIWTNHDTQRNRDNNVIAYRSWAYYFLDQHQNAMQSAQQAQEFMLCDFLLGLIQIEEENYEAARNIFKKIAGSQETGIPENLFVTPFPDNLILDDSQFLFAYSSFKLSDSDKNRLSLEILLEFAEIQRLYPASDLNDFLQSNGHFEKLINMHENGDEQEVDNFYQLYLNALDVGFISNSKLNNILR